MPNFINNWVAKWVQNRNNWLIMNFWRSNFNMPVPNITDNTIWVDWYWPVTYNAPATSFDLTWFVPWLETLCCSSVWHWDWPLVWTAYLNQRFKNPSWTVTFQWPNNYAFPLNIAAWNWYWVFWIFNQWVASWEIWTNWTYVLEAFSTWTWACSTTTNISITNCPSVSTTWTPWMIYVDWNYLAFVNYNNFLHRILWTDLWDVWWTPGMMWMDNSSDLHWIDSSWHDRKISWKIQQFASSFSNWATSSIYAWTQHAWKIWVDAEFWYTHLWYIWTNWYKYLTWAWDYPYVF